MLFSVLVIGNCKLNVNWTCWNCMCKL